MCPYYIVAKRQTKSCTLSRGFGGKEGLKDFINYFLRNTIAIIHYTDFNFIIELFRALSHLLKIGHFFQKSTVLYKAKTLIFKSTIFNGSY